MFTIDVPPVAGTKAVNGNTPTGDRLKELIGAPNSICITSGPNQVMFVARDDVPGARLQSVARWQGARRDRPLGPALKQFSGAHALACPSETEIYVAETSNWRVQKLTLQIPK